MAADESQVRGARWPERVEAPREPGTRRCRICKPPVLRCGMGGPDYSLLAPLSDGGWAFAGGGVLPDVRLTRVRL